MSTKTTFKRVAAVAAAALAISGFSAVSANAAAPTTATPFFVKIADSASLATDGSVSAATETANQVAGATNYVRLAAAADIADGPAIVTVSGASSWIAGDNTGTSATWTDNSSTGVKATSATSSSTDLYTSGTAYSAVRVYTPVAGTVTVTVAKHVDNNNGSFTDTTIQTFTITVSAASVVGQVSVANSASYITDSATVIGHTTKTQFNADAALVAADATVVASKALNTNGTAKIAGVILVTLNDTQSTSGVSMKGKKLTASISGVGLISGNDAADEALGHNSAPARSAIAYTSSDNGVAAFGVYSDGTAGVGTITVTYTDATTLVSTTISTETVTFYGSLSALSATQNLKVASTAGATLGYNGASSSATNVPAVVIKAVDSAGNLVKGLTAANFGATSSDSTVLSTTIDVTEDSDSTGLNGNGYYNVRVKSVANTSGKSATLTFWYSTDSGVTKISTSPVTFTLGGTVVYGLAFTSDADSYAPGDKVTLTLTATDKAGNAIADGPYSVFQPSGTAFAGITTSAQITSTPFASTTTGLTTFVGGVKTATFYAPYTTGSLKLSAVLAGTDLSTALATAAAVAGTVAVNADSSAQAAIDAAQEATDAANAAYDAANNAMDSADAATAAAQDASDNASAALAAVTSLSATVAKLVKSVAAIAAALAKVQKKIGA